MGAAADPVVPSDRAEALTVRGRFKPVSRLRRAGVQERENYQSRCSGCGAFGAELDGEFLGSNVARRWGSVGFFGPLTVRPDLWERKIAQRLMDPIIERFDAWGVTHAGLFTFAQSPKHLGLYYKYGFRPRFLTAIMSKPVHATTLRKSDWAA